MTFESQWIYMMMFALPTNLLMYFLDIALEQKGASVDINPAPGGFMLQPLVILLTFVHTGYGLGIFRKEREAPIGLSAYKMIFAF